MTKVSDHHVKFSGISAGGLAGSADRSLGDYLQVKTGVNGEAVLSYLDDTSGNRNNDFSQAGQTPSEASGASRGSSGSPATTGLDRHFLRPGWPCCCQSRSYAAAGHAPHAHSEPERGS